MLKRAYPYSTDETLFLLNGNAKDFHIFCRNEGLVVKFILYLMAIAPRGGGSSREGVAARQQTGGNRSAELDIYRFYVIRKIGLETITVNIAE